MRFIRRSSSLAVCLLLTFATSLPAEENGAAERRLVYASAEGRVSIPATRADFRLAIDLRRDTAEEAQREVGERSRRLMAFLKDQGVADLRTTGLSLRPLYDDAQPVRQGGRQPTRQVIAYAASLSVSFSVPAERAGPLADGAIANGATRIDSLSLAAEDAAIREARSEAIRRASREALAQAEAALEALGYQRGEVYRIRIDGPQRFHAQPMMMRGAMAESDASTAIEAGEQEVSTNVSLEVEY
jgi:uncharacterized protein